MNSLVDDVVRVMALNRRSKPKYWEKVRVDRLEKLLPVGTDSEEFLKVFLTDARVKQVQKQNDAGELLPAVQLRFEAYQHALFSH